MPELFGILGLEGFHVGFLGLLRNFGQFGEGHLVEGEYPVVSGGNLDFQAEVGHHVFLEAADGLAATALVATGLGGDFAHFLAAGEELVALVHAQCAAEFIFEVLAEG